MAFSQTPEAQSKAEARAQMLVERTRRLASVRQQRNADLTATLAFRIGSERFSVPLSAVEEVLEVSGLCPMPGAPSHVAGAIVSRLRVVVVLDLRQLLGLSGMGVSDLHSVVVLRATRGSYGVAVEEIEGLLEVAGLDRTEGAQGPVVRVTEDRVSVLDPELLERADGGAQAKKEG